MFKDLSSHFVKTKGPHMRASNFIKLEELLVYLSVHVFSMFKP